MNLDTDRIDDAVLALLLLGLHEQNRVWKNFDWDAMNRLHAKGLIADPMSKAKSVVLSEEGLEKAEALMQRLFAQRSSTVDFDRAEPLDRTAP